MALLSSLAIDDDVSPSADLTADTSFDKQTINIRKAEYLTLKCDANYWRTQFSRSNSHRNRDIQRLKDEMAQREAQYIAFKCEGNYERMRFARLIRQRDREVRRLKVQMTQREAHSSQALSKLKDQMAQRDERYRPSKTRWRNAIPMQHRHYQIASTSRIYRNACLDAKARSPGVAVKSKPETPPSTLPPSAHADNTALEVWALVWVERIGTLYHLNGLRLDVQHDAKAFALHTVTVEQHLQGMSASCNLALQDMTLHEAAGKVMTSLRRHWDGLTVFVAHPDIPMDNNLAENAVRGPVVGRKNYYGSGSKWSAQFAASMFTILLTLDQVWGVNARLWMTEFLQACAVGRGAPPDLTLFLPWAMTSERLAYFGGKPPSIGGANMTQPDSS